jgi:hypothetical protein
MFRITSPHKNKTLAIGIAEGSNQKKAATAVKQDGSFFSSGVGGLAWKIAT